MLDYDYLVLSTLKGHIRVNTSNKTVEIYDDYGVKMRLANLPEETFNAFEEKFVNF